MVQGLKFLSKKGFNPQNKANRKQVWEAQQASKHEEQRIRQRQEQLKREQEEEELQRVTKGEIGGSQAQLRFMYDAPPGMNDDNKDKKGSVNDDYVHDHVKKPPAGSSSSSSLNDLIQAKPGDDAAAVAFRQMLASSVQIQPTDGNSTNDSVRDQQQQQQPSSFFGFGPMLQGVRETDEDPNNNINNNSGREKTDNRSALEKAVGRKDRSQGNLTYQQQIERFPQLKNAPMAKNMKKAAASKDGNVEATAANIVFKPLGAQILHVKCLACGIWGHQRGDRECEKSGWNPFALPSSSSSLQPQQQQQPQITAPDASKYQKDKKSTILPEKLSKRRGRDNDDSDGKDSRDHRRRRHHHDRRKRRRRHSRHDDDSSSSSSSSSDDDDSSSYVNTSCPSSEDSRVLKRREDHGDCSDSDDNDGQERREHRRHRRKRHHKRSKKKKHHKHR
jgi:hypothetical protein